ncbi:DUF6320 domain-containing protein [Scatolibacter rhodanostii]|uniref:DUF6320 domain-containing protein n=1 Tax=Scatolibacter rhodanostii TaxID=2014781 RepID=UPI000C082601|nr:DUF6320 domain-containing protein [Scatolibacter rhodanostii]
MKTCSKCGVTVKGKREFCPLCQGKLSGEDSEEVFPLVPTVYQEFHFLFRILIFISIAVVVVAVAVNLMWRDAGWWSIFWVAGAACLWIVLTLAVRKRKNMPKWIFYQVVVISLICTLWDFVVGWSGWSIDYVVPILCLVGLASLSVLSRVLRWRVEYYMISVVVNALFGIVPLIFYITDSVSVRYPTVICVAGSVMSLAALAVFKGESMWEELKRRLSP